MNNESVWSYMITYSFFFGVLEGPPYTRARLALQLVTEQGHGMYRTLQRWVPSAGVYLNVCAKYYIRFYRALDSNLFVLVPW